MVGKYLIILTRILVATVLVVLIFLNASKEQSFSSPTSAPVSLNLIQAEPVVYYGQPFSVSFATTIPINQQLYDLGVSLYAPFSSASNYDANLSSGYLGKLLASVKLNQFQPSSSNPYDVSLDLAINNTNLPNTPTLILPCFVYCEGVYPIVVSLYSKATNSLLTSFTLRTTLLEPSVNHKPIEFTQVFQIGQSLSGSISKQNDSLSRKYLQSLEDELNVLLAAVNQSFDLNIDPYLLDLLNQSNYKQAKLDLLKLQQLSKNRAIEVLNSSYVPINLNQFISQQFQQDATSQLILGSSTLEKYLGITPLDLWVSNHDLSQATSTILQKEGFNYLVAPPTSFRPSSLALTATAPFKVQGTKIEAFPSITFTKDLFATNPEAAVLNFLGELSQVYFDSPNANYTRSLVAIISQSLNPETLALLESSLQKDPLVTEKTLYYAFLTTPLGNGDNLATRSLLPAVQVNSLPFNLIQHAKLDYGLVLKLLMPTNPLTKSLQKDIYVAEASFLTTNAQRLHYLNQPGNLIADVSRSIQAAQSKSITLTSSTANIPIIISYSGNTKPINVEVVLVSNALSFPRGNQFKVSLQNNSTLYFQVKAKANGALSASLEILIPSTRYVLYRQDIKINAQSFSVVALLLTALALFLLLYWWIRHFKGKIINKRGNHEKLSGVSKKAALRLR